MTDELITKMQELIEVAEKNNKIVPVSKAFEMFPVEDEVHEGNLSYWTKGEERIEV